MKTENIITPDILHHTDNLKSLEKWANKIDEKYVESVKYGYVKPILEKLFVSIYDAMDEISNLVGFEFKNKICWGSEPE